MQTRLPLFALLLVATSFASATTFTSTSICDNDGNIVSGTTSCRNDSNGGFSSAGTSYSYSINENRLTVITEAHFSAGGRAPVSSASSQAMIQGVIQIGTEGPIRDGLVSGEASQSAVRNGGSSYSSFRTVPGYFEPPNYLSVSYPASVQLGSPLTVYITSTAGGRSNYSSGGAEANSRLDVNLNFLEADGVTPVAIADVPEPITIALAGCGIGVLCLLRGRALKRRGVADSRPM